MIKIAGICVLGSAMCILLRQSGRNEMALITSLAITVYVLSAAFTETEKIVETLAALAKKTNIDEGIYKTVIKITGIAYITQSAAELCKDTGEGALAGKVELFGKILICSLALPAVTALIEVISDMI